MGPDDKEWRIEFGRLAMEYSERFNRPFPTYNLGGMSGEEKRELLENALETGKPVEVEIDPDVVC